MGDQGLLMELEAEEVDGGLVRKLQPGSQEG